MEGFLSFLMCFAIRLQLLRDDIFSLHRGRFVLLDCVRFKRVLLPGYDVFFLSRFLSIDSCHMLLSFDLSFSLYFGLCMVYH